MKLPSSLEIERGFIASLIRYPEVIPDYIDYLSDDLVHGDIHKVILGSIRHEFRLKKTVDPTIIANHITNIGLSERDGTDIPDYVFTITQKSAVTPDKVEIYFKDCWKYKIARETILACRETEKNIIKNINGSVSDLIAQTEKGLAKAVTVSIEDEFRPIDVYDGMPEFLEDRAERQELHGIMTPFKTWNRWWGPLTRGDLHVIAAPPKTGKSTILNYIADAPFCKYNAGKSIKVLILDTELESHRVRTRKAAALSQINESYLKNGSWQKNSDMVEAVQGTFKTMDKRKGAVWHLYVADVQMDKIKQIVKRWRATCTEPEDECIIIYDYLKITGEKIDDANKEYQVLGEKCNVLKKVCSECDCCGVAAVQTNGANDVAASQRIKWFASNIYRFRKFTVEELSEQGDKFGTHLLEPLETRNLGPDWEADQYVKEAKEKGTVWHQNFICIEVKNFDMRERGTRQDLISSKAEQLDIEKKPLMQEEDLL